MSQAHSFNELRIAMDAIRRRRRLLIITIFCGLLLSMLPVMLLPSIYESTATILVESQEIPQELVRSTVTGYIEERLQSIAQIALNRANLMAMIEQHQLYEDERKRLTTEEIIKKMRDDITLTPIQADVVGAYGRTTSATIAFSLNYKSKSPRKALNTTSSLVSLFLEENYRSREERAATTYGFLEKQNQELTVKINEIEEEIARFKEKHFNSLPEMVNLNVQALERTQQELQAKREYIRTLTDRKIHLEGQLATLTPLKQQVGTDGRPILHPSEELKVLRSQYISLSATRSERHPDIVALRQKIKALESHTGDNAAAISDLEASRLKQEARLRDVSARYTESHPEVITARNELRAIDAMLQDARQNFGRSSRQNIVPDNPAYITVETQLRSISMEIDVERSNIREMEKKYDDYQKRIELSPQVEQDYRKLQRDLSLTQAQYAENTAKLMAANEAKVLEEQRAGEKLTLIDPPMMPESPVSPNRLLIMAIGAVLSICAGGGLVALREIMDSTIHGAWKIATITNLPTMATIPYYATRQEKKRRSRQRKIIVFIGLLLIAGMVAFCHFYVMPLDVLYYTIQNKIKLYL